MNGTALWEMNRKRALRRDRGRCQSCGHKAHRVHVHHKTPRNEGGTHHLANLVTLCPTCHASVHDARACATCGGIKHDYEDYQRAVYDDDGAAVTTICDGCFSRISDHECTSGCHICDSDTSGEYALSPGMAEPKYLLCSTCRNKLIFNLQYETMKHLSTESDINFRHWEGDDE